jgi:hypothetical protein
MRFGFALTPPHPSACNMKPSYELGFMMIERMHMALKGGISADEKGQVWVALALAAATAVLLLASFVDLASI